MCVQGTGCGTHRFPVLMPKGAVDAAVYAQAHYFVTLELNVRNDSVVAEYPRQTDAWIEAPEDLSPLLGRLDAEARQVLFGDRSVQPRRPRVLIKDGPQADTSTALTLSERRTQLERPVVTRRILRRKRNIAP